MTDGFANKLGREKMQQLLSAVGSKASEDTTQIEAAEYNWHQSHYFSSDQIRKLDDFARKAASTMGKKFVALCHSEFSVTITSVTQHFAEELFGQSTDSKQNDYYLAFGTGKEQPSCLIKIPLQSAIIWATQLLGGCESEDDTNRDLSQLEESLLLDITSALVEVISESHSSFNFQPANSIVRAELPFELQGAEEFCKFTFNVEQIDTKKVSQAHLLIPCSELEPVAGRVKNAADGFSSEDISKAILGRFQEMPVFITAQLASAKLTFEELIGLQVDDVLLLDKKIDEPVELVVKGQTFFRGWPAKSGGKYAVTITEPAHDAT